MRMHNDDERKMRDEIAMSALPDMEGVHAARVAQAFMLGHEFIRQRRELDEKIDPNKKRAKPKRPRT